ncbi:hypothetical protein V1264_019210 [Littorina saxatilis]|uniref:GH10 domain-containing protein n=2 Tax=Littorina saxatilis TaxID=31220 RepID=A0AAN9GDP1_9CAEN
MASWTSCLFSLLLVGLIAETAGELLKSGGFETLAGWACPHPAQCTLTNDKHSGQHSVLVKGRHETYQGPSQLVTLLPGHLYKINAWMKLLNDHADQNLLINVGFQLTDDSHIYVAAAGHFDAKVSEGWVHVQGDFVAPHKPLKSTRIYFESKPSASVSFEVDDASVTQAQHVTPVTTSYLNQQIDQHRKSNIHFNVQTAHGVHHNNVRIHVLQTKKSFPFGSSFNAGKYNANASHGRYQDFIHKHFNWAVPENALQWYTIEHQRNHMNYQTALDAIHGVRQHGLKVRGHSLVWSAEKHVQNWQKNISAHELRHVVQLHIQQTMHKMRGLLEHWDVNNEILHFQWYQDRFHDPDYNLELFRLAHQIDPHVKLFLNDFDVVVRGDATLEYLAQAKKYKAANVGLSGMGVQCHFPEGLTPDATAIKQRLDLLSTAGVPIWVTELDVVAVDENKRADLYEAALRALYGHPAVQGIIFWGFWDQTHWRGPHAALVKGENLQLTAAGRRVLDLFENQWMTDESHDLSQSGNQFKVRGFHGDYEVNVYYQGKQHIKFNFSLGNQDETIELIVNP